MAPDRKHGTVGLGAPATTFAPALMVLAGESSSRSMAGCWQGGVRGERGALCGARCAARSQSRDAWHLSRSHLFWKEVASGLRCLRSPDQTGARCTRAGY